MSNGFNSDERAPRQVSWTERRRPQGPVRRDSMSEVILEETREGHPFPPSRENVAERLGISAGQRMEKAREDLSKRRSPDPSPTYQSPPDRPATGQGSALLTLLSGATPYDTAKLFYGLSEELPDGTLNPLIEQFHDSTFMTWGDADDAWCASFVNWVLKQHGIEGTNSPRARSFTVWGESGGPRQGNIVVFSRGSNPKKGHVGFVHSVNRGRGIVTVLGGNQDNTVCLKDYSIGRVLSYRHVTHFT